MRSFVRILMLSCIALLLVSTSMAVGITPPPTTVAWSGLQAAIDAASTGDTITLTAGTYESTATITINKDVTIDGNGSTVNVAGVGKDPWRYVFIIPAAGAGATVQNFTINKTDKAGEFNLLAIQANDVTIQDNTFTGQFAIGDGDVTRAMEVSGGLSGLSIDGNTISGLRQPAYFNPGTVGTVSDNNVDATKGWVVIGATITFTGNTWGTNAVDIYLGDGTPFGAPYDPLSAMSTANDSANIEDGRTGVNPYRVTNTTKGTAYTTIQAAIDAADAGDVIDVAAGTYAEAVTIDKAVTLQGAGNEATDTVVTVNSGIGINITASNVIVKSLRATGGNSGINVADAANDVEVNTVTCTGNTYGLLVQNVDNLHVTDCNLISNTSSGAKFRGQTDGLQISGGHFDNNTHGIYHADQPIGHAIQNATIDGATFSNNTGKGIYTEQMRDTTITNVTIDSSGTGTVWGAGIDINLKLDDYSGIVISNSTISNCGGGDSTNGAGITVKARDDGATYGANPATLDDVQLTGLTISGCQEGVRFGEPGKLNAGPTNVTVSGCTFTNNVLGDIRQCSKSGVEIDAAGNTFTGTTTDQDIEDKVWHDVDDATVGHVDWGQGAATECALVVSDLAGNAGQTLQLTAKLTADGTGLSGQPVSFQVNGADAGTGTTDIAGVAVAPHTIAAGDTTITATFAGVSNYVATTSNEGTITAGAAKATGITLALDTDDVVSGDAVTCTVTGDNGEDYTATAKYYVDRAAGGTWAGNVYTSAKAGAWTVTAVVDTLTTTANLAVDHGDAVDVTITPEEATINAGGSQEYVVTATDAAGNTWSPAGVLGEDGAGALNGNTYESVEGDAGTTVTITATVNGETATSTLNINAAAGPGLILAWDVDDMAFYLCSNATDPADGGVAVTDGMTLTVEGNDIPVTVSGGGTDVTVTIGTSSLRVQWYVRRGSLTKVYQYSTIDGNELTATYDARRTLVDGTWQTGFWGLTHTIGAETITYGSALQQGIK